MMKRILRIVNLLFLFLVFASSELFAQTINISAIIRPRAEVMYGYRFPPDTSSVPQVVISQRTRINAGYTNDRFSAYISIQDARVWGDEVTPADVPSLGIHEAWGQYNFSKKVGLKVGRQEFLYDNKRILTDGFWIQTGRAYDGGVLKLNLNKGWRIDAAGSYNQQTTTYFGNFYNLSFPKTLDFLWVNKSKVDSAYKYSISGIVLGDGFQTPDTTGIFMRYTYGINASYNHKTWGMNLEVYGQSGKTRTVNQSGNIIPDSFQTVKAYMFSINPWISPIENFQIGLGVDYISGSDALDSTNSGTTNLFNNAYGAAHRFLGRMDLFFNLPQATRNAGLIDGYLSLIYTYKKWEMHADYHYFALQNNVEDVENPGQALDKPLGSEVDLWVFRDITKEVNFGTGISGLDPTRSLEFVKSATFSQVGSPTVNGVWFWAMLTFKPVFLNKQL